MDLNKASERGAHSQSVIQELNEASAPFTVYCNGCSKIIYGIRYNCSACTNFDYCSNCHIKAVETHPDHKFYVAYNPLFGHSDHENKSGHAEESIQTESSASRTVEPHRVPSKFVTGHKNDQFGDEEDLTMPKPPQTGRVVQISPGTPSDELFRRFLGAIGQSPYHVGSAQGFDLQDPASRHVRLIKLGPGEGKTELRCDLVFTSLNEKSSYEALSYTWGNPYDLGLIWLNGQRFPVRRSLQLALQSLRQKDRPRMMWIDALCIDQTNIEERNTQVRQMKDIYTNASQVLVYLGPAADDSDTAMDFISGDLEAGSDEADIPPPFKAELETEVTSPSATEVIAATTDHVDGESKQSQSSQHGMFFGSLESCGNDKVSKDDHRKPVYQSKIRNGRYEDKKWVAVDKLVRRTWWSRVWVIQEVVASIVDPLVICGNRCVSWKQMNDFLYQYAKGSWASTDLTNTQIPTRERALISAFYRTQHLFFARHHRHDTRPTMEMYRLLHITLSLDASDPRDKVFALVGLTHERDRIALAPDYSKSLVQVYAETAKHIIRTDRRLDVLSINTDSEISREKMPSWTPDWRLSSSRPQSIYAWGAYQASGQKPVAIHPQCVGPYSDPTSMMLGGILFDEIDIVGIPILPGAQAAVQGLSSLRRCISHLHNFVLAYMNRRRTADFASGPGDPSNIPTWQRHFALFPDPRASDQFWRTLVLNKMPQSPLKRAPDIWAEMFELLLYEPCTLAGPAPSRSFKPKDDDEEDAGLRQRTGTDFPRLRTKPYPAQIPIDFYPELPHVERLARYVQPITLALSQAIRRVLFVTKGCRLGIANQGVKRGDKAVVLMGGDVPYVIRDEGRKDGKVRFIGEAYVHGVMNGEIVEAVPKEEKFEKYMMMFPFC